ISGLRTLNTARHPSLRAAVSVKTARPINTAYPRSTMYGARPASNVFNKAHSHVKNPFNTFTTSKNSNFIQKVNTVKGTVSIVGSKAVVRYKKGNKANAVNASPCWIWRPKQKVLDHVSRHNGVSMNFKRFDYVDAQGRSIISQMCDKKNNVLFTDTECVVLSPNFKLLDESQVLLRVPRKNNMYSVDLRNVAPSGATKDDTNGILKAFITGIENLIDYKVKTIRCDNGTEFKNKEMNQFGKMKGIRREFSVARTPQIFTLVTAAGPTYVYLSGLIPVNATTLSNADLPADPLMPDLEDTVDTGIFSDAYDDEVEGAEADFNNLELTTFVSPNPTTRIHKDYPK
nr:putative ribonuclease H-like domain-containing protein [Tanacetum cinerariifolium]